MLELKNIVVGLFAAAALIGCSSDQDWSPESETLAETSEAVLPAPVYPLRIAANARYLEDQGGKPFFWLGDSVWAGAASLTPSEMDLYLDNRNAKGFSVALVSLLERKFSKNAPNDAAGHPPFNGTLSPGVFDISKPNDAYFATVEAFFQKAAARGMAVLVCHNYLGYDGGDEGWFSTLKANGPGAVRQLGRYIGNRYKNQSNLIWLAGGDYTPASADRWVVDEAALGIREGGANQLMTVHSSRGENSADLWGSRSWYNLQSIYSGPPSAIPPLFHAAYARQPVRPSFLLEARYENHLDWTPAMMRYQAYQPYLTGGMGQMFGNDPIWHPNGPGLGAPLPFTWQQAMDQQGSQDMARLAAAFAGKEWWKLVPDVNHSLVTSGFGSGLSEIVAARTPDAKLAMVYVPSTGTGAVTFTTAMSQFPGAVSASWYNPTTGAFSTVPGSPFANSGSRNLSTPGNNGTSTNDWLLVLTSSATAPVLTSIAVTPGSTTVVANRTRLFAATAYDQSGQPLASQPSFSWAVSGGGSISGSGLFTAGASAGGPHTVTARAAGKTGAASVSVTVEDGAGSVLNASADALVRSGDSGATNFGTLAELLVKTDGPGWDRQSYVKFDTSSVSSISSAKLRVFGNAAGGELVTVQAFGVSSAGWSETSLTWNNKPAVSTNALSSVTVSANTWYEFDVSAYVSAERAAGRTQVSIALLNPSRNVNPATFNSREAGSNRPQLVVTGSAGAPNQAPTIATSAAANPAVVSGNTTSLSVLGGDDAGEGNLTYSWATTGTPPAAVSFGPSMGKAVTATFSKAGSYSIQATVTDQAGLSTTSSVNVTVSQTLSSVAVTPGSAMLSPNTSRQFSATGADQFGSGLLTQPSFGWSVSGGGSISSNGSFTAGSSAGGPFTVSAASGGKSGSASVTIVSNSAFTLRAVADAFVRDGDYGTMNFGDTTDLQIKNDGWNWTRQTYLKFDLSSLSSSTSSVKLRLFGSVPGGEQVPIHVFPVASSTWSETSITWNDKPVAGTTPLGFVTIVGETGTWYEWDVTAYVRAERAAGRNLVSFVLLNLGANTQLPTFASDEAASNWPQLLVTSG